MANERFTTRLLTVFAALGLVLAGIWLYRVRCLWRFATDARVWRAACAGRRRLAARAPRAGSWPWRVVAAALLVGIAAAIMAGRVMTSTLRYVETPGLSTYASSRCCSC
jgi:hypothetical protein